MTQPIVITLPHRLGKAEAPRTILVGWLGSEQTRRGVH
jgi:hypothetical protein